MNDKPPKGECPYYFDKICRDPSKCEKRCHGNPESEDWGHPTRIDDLMGHD